MAKDAIPSVQSLDKPEDLKKLLKEGSQQDCLSCRLIGGGAFIALAGYNYLTGMGNLNARRDKILASKSMFGMRSRQFGVASISFGLLWMGVYRLRN